MSDLVCSASAAFAYDFFVRRGLRDFQAAAIVGNLQQESKFNTQAIGDGGRAHGIAQWWSPRWDNLIAFASQSGRSPWALDAQLGFVWHELQTIPAFGLRSILAATTLEAATVAFQDNFERCGTCDTPSRIWFAKSALYACPRIAPPVLPPSGSKVGTLAATAGLFALVAAAGYGAYKAEHLSTRHA